MARCQLVQRYPAHVAWRCRSGTRHGALGGSRWDVIVQTEGSRAIDWIACAACPNVFLHLYIAAF